jgi:hypothetical protein
MTIDTGLNLAYNANFPSPGVDQSSQTFRDNFAIIKSAIENLQIGINTSNSVITLETLVDSGTGEITFALQFGNNGFTLPIGLPSSGTQAGMICYRTDHLEFFDGSAWHPLVYSTGGVVAMTTATVSTRLSLGYSPTQPTDAVPLSYVQAQVAVIANTISTQTSTSSAAIAAVQADLNAEKVNRTDADTNLQDEINTINTTLSNTNSTANATSGQLSSVSQALSDETNARISADTLQSNSVLVLTGTVSNAVVFLTAVSADLVTEVNNRTVGDQGLSDRINAVVSGGFVDSATFTAEVNARTNGDSSLSNAVANNANNLANAIANSTATESALGTAISNKVSRSGDTMIGTLTMLGADIIVQNSSSANTVTFSATSGDINTIGNVVAQGDVTGFSDASLKANVKTIENALDKVDALRGVIYERLDLDGQVQMGLIAQEALLVIPEVVRDVGNGLLGITYGNISALLIEAIKELRVEINEIKARLP